MQTASGTNLTLQTTPTTSGKFSYRNSTRGFHEANPDGGDIQQVSYALREVDPEAEKRIIELVKAPIS